MLTNSKKIQTSHEREGQASNKLWVQLKQATSYQAKMGSDIIKISIRTCCLVPKGHAYMV